MARNRPSTPPDDSVDLAEFLAALERHRVLAATTVLLIVAGGMFWASTRPPVYRTTATLKLEEQSHAQGVLSDLAALTSAPAAEGEMSILRSRALVEATVADPRTPVLRERAFTPTPADEFQMEAMHELGLGTRVESQGRLPLRTLFSSLGFTHIPSGRLFAHLEGGADAPRRIEVSFPEGAGEKRVRLAIPSRRGIARDAVADFDYMPGMTVQYQGAQLRLEAVGDCDGATFQVERRSIEQTVDDCLGKLDVAETSRNSGVIRLTVSDSDPDRAAEFANALCHNYLLRSILLGRSRASRTIRFVEEQLTEQKKLLEEAEREVVALQQKNPEVILVSASAESLLKRVAESETELSRLELARVALGEALERLDQGDMQALARLTRELPDPISASYIEAIGRLGSQSQALGLSDAGPTKALLQQKLSELELERHQTQASLEAIERALPGLRAGEASALTRLYAESPELASIDPATGQYLGEVARIENQLSALHGDLTPENPEWKRLRGAQAELGKQIAERIESVAAGLRLAQTDKSALTESFRSTIESWPAEERTRIDGALAELTRSISHNLHARIESLAGDEKGLREQVAALESELARLPESERAVAGPLRRREAHAQIVKLLLDSEQQAQLSMAATLPSAILIDPAIPPTSRHAPKLFFDFLLCCAAGLGAALLAVFLRQALSGALHSQAEVEEWSGLPVFGSIPDFRHGRLRIRRARASCMPLRDDPDGAVAEAYRSLRESLRFSGSDPKGLRTLACTSCAPGEGKTTTNINLALAFAGQDKRVLLVDADMRIPAVQRYFELPLSPGLGEVLEDRASWSECVRPSGQPGLDLLTAGKPHNSPADLLRSTRIAELIAEWRERYDMVVFDLPPALAVADTEILARELDALLFVYRSGGVHRDALTAMVRKLTRAGSHVRGAVVNAVQPTRTGAGSYYGGYYGSHSGESRAPRRGAASKRAS
ncbi:MAG: polysaccharide biosynthesis tyrosine autokinase [Planctomycetes bacterium]|nr:polysaccharide biosynthesis tyrosine autokinase [Planctomycetota bacterium]